MLNGCSSISSSSSSSSCVKSDSAYLGIKQAKDPLLGRGVVDAMYVAAKKLKSDQLNTTALCVYCRHTTSLSGDECQRRVFVRRGQSSRDPSAVVLVDCPATEHCQQFQSVQCSA